MTVAIENDVEVFKQGMPGVYANIPAEVYHRLPAVSSTVLKKLHTASPLHCRHYMDERMEPSDEMDIGSAAHCMLFTPSEFAASFSVSPICQAVTAKGDACRYDAIGRDAGGAWLCGVHGKNKGVTMPAGLSILSPDNMARAEGIAESVKHHRDAWDLLQLADERELSVTHLDPDTGLLLKVRLDLYCSTSGIMPDLKTCRSSDPRKFKYQARDLAYHLQLAFYRHVAKAAGLDIGVTTLIAVENTAPFAVTVFEPSDSFMLAGYTDAMAALAKFAECRKSGVWPAYSNDIVQLDLP